MATPSRSALLAAIAAKLDALTDFVEADEETPEKMSMYMATQSARVGFALDMPAGAVESGRQRKRANMTEVVNVGLMVDVRQYKKRDAAMLGLDTEDRVVTAMLVGFPGWHVFYDGCARSEAKAGALRRLDLSFVFVANINFAGA